MSRSGRRFVPALRRIRDELTLPEPTRSRILLEIAADLEALYEHYRAAGLGEDAAAERAQTKLLASPEALRLLVEVHSTAYERLIAGVAGRMRWGLDAVLVLVGMVPVALAAAAVVVPGPGRPVGGLVAGAVLVLAALVVAIGSWKAYQLLVRRERSPAALHRGVFELLFLGGLGPVLGALGLLLGIYRATGAVPSEADGAAARRVVEAMAAGGTVFVLGVLLWIVAGLVWFVLIDRIAEIERTESAVLLAG